MTGAGQGIGRAIALAFAREKASVAVIDGRGSVINFASNAGTEGMARNAPYAAAKEAIRGFSRSAARERARDQIRVNVIRPIANSPSTLAWGEVHPAQKRASESGIPLGRFGDCDLGIAPAAVFLASDESLRGRAKLCPVLP